jgi:hypothetical protein
MKNKKREKREEYMLAKNIGIKLKEKRRKRERREGCMLRKMFESKYNAFSSTLKGALRYLVDTIPVLLTVDCIPSRKFIKLDS